MSNNKKSLENVLILQGGGSLGAFGCGVYKALVKNNINVDILAGTSIGAVNAAIIAGSRNDDDKPEKVLEEFWLELGENFINLDTFYFSSPSLWSSSFFKNYYSFLSSNTPIVENYSNLKSLLSFYSSALYGNDAMFLPRWKSNFSANNNSDFSNPSKWTYLYDNSPLEKTLEKYIDYEKLTPTGKPNGRLIITAVNVLTAEPLTFDSSKTKITSKHILASSGYPFYFLPWTEIEKGIYGWDGGLLSNTPLREVIDASPVNNKQIFLVENYPKNINKLPENILDVLHRARDIVFSDKTMHNIKMSKVITRYLEFIDELYQIIDKNVDKEKLDKEKLRQINLKYKKFKLEHGAEIKKILYITREEDHRHHMYENADFSLATIKDSIKQGEIKTNEALAKLKN
ncbi:MAG: patatin-like phospholipase family protein [Nitrososphaeraceae archaeon]